jgi:hypothetical protein
MFPTSEFKENYLYTSNESVNRKEDRILNREYNDPYKFERKIADMYEREDNSKKFNLNTQPNDSFKATLGTFPNMSSSPGNMLIQEEEERDNNFSYENYHKRNFSSPMSPEEEIIPNLNYKYDDHNKFKREGGHSKNNSNLSEVSTGRNNQRYKSRSNFSEEFNPNTQSNPIVNVSYMKEIKTEQPENYNNELKYYKEMIEKMHSEIGNLNSKLSEIEKNNMSSGKNIGHLGTSSVSGTSGTFNNLIHNNPNSSTRSYTNSQLSTANFRKENNKQEVSDLVSEKNTHRDLQDFHIGQVGHLSQITHLNQLSNLNQLGLKNKTEKILNLTNTEKVITTENLPSRMNFNYDNTPLSQNRDYLLKKEDEKINLFYKDYKDHHNTHREQERERENTINYNLKMKIPDSPSHSKKTDNIDTKLINSLGVIKPSHNLQHDNSDIVKNLLSKKNIPSQQPIRHNNSKTPNRLAREEKSTNSKSTKTRSTSVDKFKRNNSSSKISEAKSVINQSNSSNHSKITKSTGKNLNNNKQTLTNQSTPTAKKPSVSLLRRNSKQESEVITNLQRENEELKSKVANLEKSLKSINYQLSLDTLEKKGRDYLRVELDIWKSRSETIANSYLDTMANMKKQLMQDKANFVDQIKSMQNTYTGEINELKNKYQSTLDRYENSTKRLRKDNEELKSKVSKVKEILTPNNK